MMCDGGLHLVEARRRATGSLGYSPAVDAEQAFNTWCRFPHFPAGTR